MAPDTTTATAAQATPTTWQASDVIPSLRYRDALGAIDWLERAFGFERHAVYAEGDVVHHAQLRFGSGMIMLGSAREGGEWPVVTPVDAGGVNTGGIYVIV